MPVGSEGGDGDTRVGVTLFSVTSLRGFCSAVEGRPLPPQPVSRGQASQVTVLDVPALTSDIRQQLVSKISEVGVSYAYNNEYLCK